MKIGEKIIVERVPSGLYKIVSDSDEGIANICGAASAAMVISNLVFRDEASGDLIEKAA